MKRWIPLVLIFVTIFAGCGESENSDKDKEEDKTGNHCTSFENTENLLVDYRWGNQISGSELQITESGDVILSERTCCPPSSETIETPAIDTETLAKIKQARQEIVNAHLVEKEGLPSSNGGGSGAIYVFDGNTRCIAKLHPNDSSNDKQIDKSASATAAVELLRTTVTSMTEEKMP